MNSQREFVAATDLTMPAYLLAAVAIVWQWAWRGRMLGGRMVRLRVVRVVRPGGDGGADTTTPLAGAGIGWWSAIKRLTLSWLVGLIFVPGLLVAFGLLWWLTQSGLDRFAWMAWLVLVASLIVQAIVSISILIAVVKRRDPIYDRWAGTAAVVG